MDDQPNCVVLTVRLTPALSGRLLAFADSQNTTRSELVRRLIERAIAGDPVAHQSLEKSLRFIHVGIDALLRYHPERGIRDEVLQIQKALVGAREGAPVAGEGRA